MTDKQISGLQGKPPEQTIPKLIEESGSFSVKFSPFANDPCCKIVIGKDEFLMTTEQMKKVVAKL